MLALIDADSLLYKVGFAIEDKTVWNEFDVEAGLEDSPDTTLSTDLDQCYQTFDRLVENIIFAVDADEHLLVFSGGHNFRYDFPIDYKVNRTDARKPEGYDQILEHAKLNWDTYTTDGIEADDYVVWYKDNHDEVILCAIDKDVLYQTVGTHYNYNKDEEVTTDEDDAIRYAYQQTLSGDTSDGYRGCKGIGEKRAIKILDGCDSELEMWEATIATYESKGQTAEEALWTMRLANMHQFDGEKINLWNPPK